MTLEWQLRIKMGGESGLESTWWAITAAISGTFSRFIKRLGSDLPADRNRGSVQPIWYLLGSYSKFHLPFNTRKVKLFCSIAMLAKVLSSSFLLFLWKFFHSLKWIPRGTQLYLSPYQQRTHKRANKCSYKTIVTKVGKRKTELAKGGNRVRGFFVSFWDDVFCWSTFHLILCLVIFCLY